MPTALPSIGTLESARPPSFSSADLIQAVQSVRATMHVVQEGQNGRVGVALEGTVRSGGPGWSLLGTLPPLYPEWLGDRGFCETHGVRFPYMAGAMANGITTTDMVIAMAEAGMLSMFGAAGLSPERIGREIAVLEKRLGDRHPWGSNLIHAPHEPHIEAATVDLYIQRGVKRASASAFMGLTGPLVRFAYTGVRELPDGRIHRERFVFAKISRPEVARRFLTPAPAELLEKLVASGELTAEEARLARRLPVAEDVIVEADSGGHTDNRPLPALFPVIRQLRDELVREFAYSRPIRVGAAGGLGTPDAVAAAFALGAAFVLTGSVNQSAIESGLAPFGKQLLCNADLADVVMAPAADMFELGVTVQVLRRGTMFGVRAQKLYEVFQAWPSLDAIPAAEKKALETQILQKSCEEVWAGCEAFFAERDPRQVEKARRDPRHKMALVFRWYLGLSSKWAIAGDPGRKMDYQIWCGPAMGAFNAWVKGSFLEKPEDRTVVQIARNLLEGAAVVTRAQQLRTFGVPVPAAAFQFVPRPLS